MKIELYNDHFQNFKRYNIPKAQLVIADIPYNLGNNAYASSNEWYVDGDLKKGESNKAGKSFFDTDENFKIAEYMHFCSKLLIKEPKEKGKAPAMIVFCAFQQMQMVIEYAEKYGFKNYIPLVFIKNSSAQVLKANMKIVGATEYGLVLYREKLPKFNNNGKMIFNWFKWETDSDTERARKFAIKCWQGFGCANLYHNGFKSGQQGHSPNCAIAWNKLPERLQEATKRLKNVQIENLDALELIRRYDTKDVFIYCDPPYLLSTRKSNLYKYEMSEHEHVELLELLKKHPGKVLISGYDNELYNSILTGWHKEFKETLAEQGLKRTECLWMNYEIQMKLF